MDAKLCQLNSDTKKPWPIYTSQYQFLLYIVAKKKIIKIKQLEYYFKMLFGSVRYAFGFTTKTKILHYKVSPGHKLDFNWVRLFSLLLRLWGNHPNHNTLFCKRLVFNAFS